MNIPKETIESELKNRIKVYTLCNFDNSEYYNNAVYIIDMCINTTLHYADIYKLFIDKYNIKDTKIMQDFFQYFSKIISIHSGVDIDSIKSRYIDDYKMVEERMHVRLELYKEGWNIEQIEKYMYKVFYKESFPKEAIKDTIYVLKYKNLSRRLCITINNANRGRGRPSFPPILKQYTLKMHKDNLKKNMREIYEGYTKYINMKASLTEEDIREIKENINESVVLKLRELIG